MRANPLRFRTSDERGCSRSDLLGRPTRYNSRQSQMKDLVG